MCGRYVTPAEYEMEYEFFIGRKAPNRWWTETFERRYNVAPQQGNPKNFVPVIREDDDGELELVWLQWWLLPFWSKEARIKFSTFNARVENVKNAASFRDPLKRRRCIIPAVGWYEWQELPTGNLPWYLRAQNGKLLAGAGRWDHWVDKATGEVIESCSIVVGPANKTFTPIHDRMPFALNAEQATRWLDRGMIDAGKALELLKPNADDAIAFHRVDRWVSNARNQGEELIRVVEAGNEGS